MQSLADLKITVGIKYQKHKFTLMHNYEFFNERKLSQSSVGESLPANSTNPKKPRTNSF